MNTATRKASRHLLALLLVFITLNQAFAVKKDPSTPDFAYPLTVAKDARARLDKALAGSDTDAAIRALIDLSLAESAIDPASLQEMIALTDSLADDAPTAASRSLLLLLEAQQLTDAYNSNRWTYDQRTVSPEPRPADITEWSGDQYRSRIDSLCLEAFPVGNPQTLAALRAAQLKQYAGLITTGDDTFIYYPHLADFIALRVVGMLTNTLPAGGIPVDMLTPAAENPDVARKLAGSRQEISRILGIYDAWLNSNPRGSRPWVTAELSRLAFLRSRVYSQLYEEANLRYATLVKDLYMEFRNTPSAPDILVVFATLSDNEELMSRHELRQAIKTVITSYPEAVAVNQLKNILGEMELRKIEFDMPDVVTPGEPFDIRLHADNCDAVTLSLYRVTTSAIDDSYYRLKNGMPTKPLSTVSARFTADGTPFSADTTLTLTIDEPGTYILVPTDPVLQRQGTQSCRVIRATHLALGLSELTKREAITVDRTSGAPVEGVTISNLIEENRKQSLKKIGQTDAEGFFTLPKDTRGQLLASKGIDRFAPMINAYARYRGDAKGSVVEAVTDLAVYHPGDSVRFMAVAYGYERDRRQALTGMKLSATLHDANREVVDSLDAMTDEFGRISGSFTIPTGRLTGYYSIRFDGAAKGRAGFTVSDYKLPTFRVETPVAVRDFPEKGDITIRGKAVTYAGLPVADATVTMQLSSMSPMRGWWGWWGNPGDPFYSASGKTDAEGGYEITIDSATIAVAPYPQGIFSANVTVSSTAAESHDTSCRFINGKPFTIMASPATDINVAEPVDFNVRVAGPDGNDTTATVGYQLIAADGKTVADGSISTGSEKLDLKKVPSGIYTLRLSMADADSVSIENIALYRPSDKMPPRESLIWMPVKRYDTPTEILYGTTAKVTNLLVTVTDADSMISRRWLTLKPGMHRFKPEFPAGCAQLTVTMLTTSGGRSETVEVKMQNPAARRAITIGASTFRDKLIPGSGEQWTLTVRNADGTPARAAVMVDIYNAALDAIAAANLRLRPRTGYMPSLSLIAPRLGNRITESRQGDYKWLPTGSIATPEFNTYGMNFTGVGRLWIRSYSRALAVSEDSDDGGVLYEQAAPAPMAANAKMAMLATGAADVTSVEEHAEEVEVTEEESGATAGGEKPDGGFNFRTGDLTIALFEPMLVTDSLGQLTCRFTVPDANATLSMNALAFTDDILTAATGMEVIAAKRVIVTPNLPRFLRTGDVARLAATVFNNIDTAAEISTVIEIFDPATGKVTQSRELSQTIAARGSQIADMTVDVPADAPFMGYRVRSASADGVFSDGEQRLIPVLPSVTPVIESTPFYIAPGSKNFTLDLPPTEADDRITVSYCDNPLWYVVTALPGLRTPDFKIATYAAASLFSTSVATHLMATQPELAEAVRKWSAAGSADSTLTSMLSRNSDLKTMLLQATPWMMDAASDTERMQRLALLFDPAEVAKARDASVDMLRSLSVPDGGWKWCAGSSDWSQWTTESTLLGIGLLNRLGIAIPDEVRDMAYAALSRLERQMLTDYARNKDLSCMNFAQICNLWKDFKPTAKGAELVRIGVRQVGSRWKKMPLDVKPEAAMLLFGNNRKGEAEKVLESLRQYASTSPAQGMWWKSEVLNNSFADMLITASSAAEAFHAIEPSAPATDMIRQWLIIQKQTTDWGTAPIASRVAASVLATTDKWISKAGDVRISLDGKEIAGSTASADNYTGELRADLSGLTGTPRLTVSRSSATPAWGSVTRRAVRPMSEVEAAGCDAVSITKRIYRSEGTGWVAADTLAAGDRVRVELTIKATRTIDYVAITDDRAACLEPVEQTPGYVFAEGIAFYRENRDAATNLFIDRMPAGTYRISYDMWVNNAGRFTSGIATLQSQYAPEMTAHSGASPLTVR